MKGELAVDGIADVFDPPHVQRLLVQRGDALVHFQVRRLTRPSRPSSGQFARIIGTRIRPRDGGGRIEVRWSSFDTGAAHPKLLLVQHRSDVWMNWGSANFTRRNLADLDLESAVELRMPARSAPARAAAEYFAKAWSNAAAGSSDADEPIAAYWRYRFAEATGLSSF
jgi:hypothetical protein